MNDNTLMEIVNLTDLFVRTDDVEIKAKLKVILIKMLDNNGGK